MGTITTLKITAAAAALAAVAGLAGAAPASAETQTARDARGDVENAPILLTAPKPNIDIIGLKNTYRARKLTMSLDFANLQRNEYATIWNIATPSGSYTLVFDRTGPDPRVLFFGNSDSGTTTTLRPGIPPQPCEGVEVERAGDTLTGTVPRRCIDGADEVRIAALAAKRGQQQSTRTDDSRRKGLSDNGNAKFGPILERN